MVVGTSTAAVVEDATFLVISSSARFAARFCPDDPDGWRDESEDHDDLEDERMEGEGWPLVD
jgi:hypothetical protein